jgi:hypothetical protein
MTKKLPPGKKKNDDFIGIKEIQKTQTVAIAKG